MFQDLFGHSLIRLAINLDLGVYLLRGLVLATASSQVGVNAQLAVFCLRCLIEVALLLTFEIL
jgi:hypothetical protein